MYDPQKVGPNKIFGSQKKFFWTPKTQTTDFLKKPELHDLTEHCTGGKWGGKQGPLPIWKIKLR